MVRNKSHSKIEFGKKLKKQRQEHLQITQPQLAAEMNVSPQTVMNWEQGYNFPDRIEDVLKLADILGCDLDYLLGSQKEPQKEYSHIADMTGLSYDAAAYLHNLADNKELNEAYLNVLSGLICQMQIAEKGRDSSLLLDMSNLIYGDFSPDSEENAAMFNAFYKSEFMGLYGQLERFVENFRDRINSEKED